MAGLLGPKRLPPAVRVWTPRRRNAMNRSNRLWRDRARTNCPGRLARLPDRPAGPDRLELEDVRRAVSCLPARRQSVIRLRYVDGMSLALAAAVLGVTPERVRQIEARAVLDLYHLLRSYEP